MSTRDELKSRLFLRVALPLVKVVREEDPRMRRLTRNMNAVVQFVVRGTDTGAHLVFADNGLEVVQGVHEKSTVCFTFKDLKSLNDFFAGKLALPSIKGIMRLDVILRTLPLLLSLKMLMPAADPKDPAKRALNWYELPRRPGLRKWNRVHNSPR